MNPEVSVKSCANDGTHCGPPQQADDDVGGVVLSQIEACVAVEQRPECRGKGEASVAHEGDEQHGEHAGVGGVSREEAVVGAAVVIDDVDDAIECWFVAWSQALHPWLHDAFCHAIGNEQSEQCASDDE